MRRSKQWVAQHPEIAGIVSGLLLAAAMHFFMPLAWALVIMQLLLLVLSVLIILVLIDEQ